MEIDANRLKHVDAFVFDIEGTICSISFVKDILYPYFTAVLPQYTRDNWTDANFEALRRKFPIEAQESPDALIKHCQELVAKDVKESNLKELQGRIWTSGYHNGSYAAPLYADVLPLFQRLHAAKHTLAIYSSGSVEAQRLFLAHVAADGGSTNITSLFKGTSDERLFDTVNAGPKTEAASYTKIAARLERSVDRLCFFTDNVNEAGAATSAGVYTVVVVRPGNAPLPPGTADTYPVLEELSAISQYAQ